LTTLDRHAIRRDAQRTAQPQASRKIPHRLNKPQGSGDPAHETTQIAEGLWHTGGLGDAPGIALECDCGRYGPKARTGRSAPSPITGRAGAQRVVTLRGLASSLPKSRCRFLRVRRTSSRPSRQSLFCP